MSTAPVPRNVRDARRLVVIDLENIAGEARLSPSRAADAIERLAAAIDLGPRDDLVVAADRRNAAVAFFATPPQARRLIGRGPDGADLRLAEVLLTEEVAARYGTVVIASGDGMFTGITADLRRQGVTVLTVSRMRSTSIHLRLAADNTIYLDGPAVVARLRARRAVSLGAA